MKKTLILAAVLAAVAVSGSAMAADTATVSVSASVTGTCKFTSGGSVAFGALDPGSTANVTGTVVNPTFWCTKGSNYSIADDNGANETGTTFRMLNTTVANEYIPYAFSYTPTSGTGSGPQTSITLTITSSILNADYVNAAAGSYADTVTLTITP